MKRLGLAGLAALVILAVLGAFLWQATHPAALSVSQVQARCATHPHLRLRRPITVRGVMEFDMNQGPPGRPNPVGELCTPPRWPRALMTCLVMYGTVRPTYPIESIWRAPHVLARGELICGNANHLRVPALTNVSSVSRVGPFGVTW